MREKRSLGRRDFLKGIGLGFLGGIALKGELLRGEGLSALDTPQDKVGQLYGKLTSPAKVSLVKGNDRREIVYESLKMIEDDILASISGKQVLIKPNIVLSNRPLAATHVDAVKAVLDFLTPHYKKQVIIGESGVQNTLEGFKNYGYFKLEQEYNVKVVDFNLEPYQYRYVFGKENQPQPLRIVSALLDPNVYIISVARMKTHDNVLITLALKNVLLGCPIIDRKGNDKGLMHGPVKALNDHLHFNMFHLAQEVFPDLAVIDGFEAMEGNGPSSGTPFDARVAIASRDAVAADIIGTKIMGFDPKRVLYLTSMAEAGMGQGDLEKIKILGTPLSQCLYRFKPHVDMARIFEL